MQGFDPSSGEAFPNLDMAVKAAMMGAGLVMADIALCREEINSGALVLPLPDMTCEEPYGNYAIIGARDRWDDPKVRKFREWAAEAAQQDARETKLSIKR